MLYKSQSTRVGFEGFFWMENLLSWSDSKKNLFHSMGLKQWKYWPSVF